MSNNEFTVPDGTYITADEFRQRMGWKSLRNVYIAISNDRVKGAIRAGKSWLIPNDAIAIDKRHFKTPVLTRPNSVRQYLFVMDGVELWAEQGWIYLYDTHTLIREKDTMENRAKLIDMAKDF